MELDHPDLVAEQYATPRPLERRAAVWGPGPEGRTPQEIVLEQVVAECPESFLDAGCGAGAFAWSVMDALPQVLVQACDASPAMVERARERGVPATVGDLLRLPFEETFDVVTCQWVLYHVPDLDAAVAELRRVTEPGGVCLVATNGREHLADLFDDAGVAAPASSFTSEDGAEVLGRRFDDVRLREVVTTATFADAAAVRDYLATLGLDAPALDDFDEPRTYTGRVGLFTCR